MRNATARDASITNGLHPRMHRDQTGPLAVGLIGYGAIGQAVASAIGAGRAGQTVLRAVLCRDPARHDDRRCTNDVDAFLASDLDLLIEAAGQEPLRAYGERILRSGRSLLVTSIGAFADDALLTNLADIARSHQVRLYLASGALPAVDWMASAALAGPCTAAITQSKPVASWRGTAAESLAALDRLHAPSCFFEGSARDAARLFPKSSNITAMLAIITAGLDHTRVKLVADPCSDAMHTLIQFASAVGRIKVEWEGVPSVLNPKTSADVPLNVIKALRNLSDPVCFGP